MRTSSYRFPDELRSDDLTVRYATADDVQIIAPAFVDPEIGGEAGLPPVGAEMLAAALATEIPRMRENGLLCPYVIEGPDGTLLGGVALHHFDPMRDTLEVGYWLFHEARGRGVATRAVQAATDHAFANGSIGWRRTCASATRLPSASSSGSASSGRASSAATCATTESASTRHSSRCSRRTRSRVAAGSLRLAPRPVEVDEAGQVRGQQRESGQHLDHRRAPGTAALGEDVPWRRDERRRDRVVEEVGEARQRLEPGERVAGSNAQRPTYTIVHSEEEREPEKRQPRPAQEQQNAGGSVAQLHALGQPA